MDDKKYSLFIKFYAAPSAQTPSSLTFIVGDIVIKRHCSANEDEPEKKKD